MFNVISEYANDFRMKNICLCTLFAARINFPLMCKNKKTRGTYCFRQKQHEIALIIIVYNIFSRLLFTLAPSRIAWLLSLSIVHISFAS